MKTTIALAFALFAFPAQGISREQCDVLREKNHALLVALEETECAGIELNERPLAVGDAGSAHGWLQLHIGHYRDAKKESPWLPSYEEVCKDKELSECVAVSVWQKYSKKCKTDEQKARVHNGGPTWNLRKKAITNTLKYWKSVKSHLTKWK